jgi:hypothetical protein
MHPGGRSCSSVCKRETLDGRAKARNFRALPAHSLAPDALSQCRFTFLGPLAQTKLAGAGAASRCARGLATRYGFR